MASERADRKTATSKRGTMPRTHELRARADLLAAMLELEQAELVKTKRKIEACRCKCRRSTPSGDHDNGTAPQKSTRARPRVHGRPRTDVTAFTRAPREATPVQGVQSARSRARGATAVRRRRQCSITRYEEQYRNGFAPVVSESYANDYTLRHLERQAQQRHPSDTMRDISMAATVAPKRVVGGVVRNSDDPRPKPECTSLLTESLLRQ